MRSVVILILSALLLGSCSKNANQHGLKYTSDEFNQLTSGLTLVNSTGENAIPFFDYSPGVNKSNSKTFIYERLKFYAVEFETEDQARSEALRLNQYYSRNYLFDRVEGEPILEDYLIATFKASNPNRSVQRAAKKSEGHSLHGGEHGNAHSTHQ